MKISPLHGRGGGVGYPESGRTHPEGYAFYPSQRGDFPGGNYENTMDDLGPSAIFSLFHGRI